VILDVVGAKYLAQNVDALADYGRLVVIGLQGGTKGELDLGQLLKKRAAVVATALRPRPIEEKGAIMNAVRDAVWPLVTDGRIRPLVAKTFPLDQVQAAHEYFDSGDHVGKILLLM
jgi:NADPH2:quinone reductase